MTPGTKRTIITSKTTGRRYFLVRSASRPSGRRYYVCTNPNCKTRVSREADLFCKAHAERPGQEKQSEIEDLVDISGHSDQMDDNDIQDNGEVIDEEIPTKGQRSSNVESSLTDHSIENGNNDSSDEDNVQTANGIFSEDNSTLLSSNAQLNPQARLSDTAGIRTIRDRAGRRRYLCTQEDCTNILKRQSDQFCHLHTFGEKVEINNKRKSRSQKRLSAPALTNQSKKSRFRSPFQPPENGTNGNHSDGNEAPKRRRTPIGVGTDRFFRDASGKLRFLCSIPGCTSRVPRRSELYCKRHQVDHPATDLDNNSLQLITTNGGTVEENVNQIEDIDVQQTDINASFQQTASETPIRFDNKKRKRGSSIIQSSIPGDQIVIATTSLLDDQWAVVLSFLRQFPQVQLSTNLNVNNFTTHLLVDDSESHLHCTITKKIVQAAVRHHVFIISSRWLNECMRVNTFIDEHPYEIISDSHTTLRLSKQEFNLTNKYLFGQNVQFTYAFAIECRQCQGSINRSELIELIQLTGAQVFQNEQAVEILIVLCDTNDKNLNKIKEKYIHAPASNIKYVTSDFLLKSIIKFEIQDIDKYSL